MRKPAPVRKAPPIDYRNGLAPELEPVRKYDQIDGRFYHSRINPDVLAILAGRRDR